MAKKNLDVTIIIPGFLNDEYTGQLHQSLCRQGYEKSKILVNVHPTKTFAQKCNEGAQKATTKYILFLNNDTEPGTNFIETMLASIEKEDEWVVTPKIMFKKTVVRHCIFGGEVKHVFGVKDKVQCAGVDFNAQGLPYEFGRMTDPESIGVRFRRRCLAATGCCFLIERQKFLDIGGFDETFVNGWEDNDFMLRVLERGGICVYEPAAVIRHHFAGSEGRFDNEEFNFDYFLQKWSGKNIPLILEARRKL